jgi:hypothetical protein
MLTVRRRLRRLETAAERAAITSQAQRDERRKAALKHELEGLSEGALLLLIYAEDEDAEGELRPWDDWLVSLCDQVPADRRMEAQERLASVPRWNSLGAVEAVGTMLPSDYWRARFLSPSPTPIRYTR